jgi:hypothetical protein
MFAGITPPASGNRTTCPNCSHTRAKQREKCLVINPNEWGMAVYCHHCKYEDLIV